MIRPIGRRSLLATLGSFTGLAALELARPASAFAERARAPMPDGPWDLSWLDTLKGKHKQVFDTGSVDYGLAVVTNYLDAAQEVFGMSYPDVNTVVGIGHSAYPYNAKDEIWAKYEIGRRWKIKEPGTDQWATRNIYVEGTPRGKKVIGIKLLLARGTIFWQCNNALRGLTAHLATKMKMEPSVVRAELIAGLLPGVYHVIAHTMAIGLAQERGCTYESLG